jgi:bifunctional NMN adenylyltransferase/nudix hydrolase
MDYKLAVFIGRFQPVHEAHTEVIRQGLKIAENVLIIIGSAYASCNIKNPFSAEERQTLISLTLTPQEISRVKFEYVRDYYYNEDAWISNVQGCVSKHSSVGDTIALLGSYKDSSSYYLNLFPQYEVVTARGNKSLDATSVRQYLFDSGSYSDDGWNERGNGRRLALKSPIEHTHPATQQWLVDNFIGTDRHHSLIKEAKFIEDYKAKWSTAPFPPTFVTTDCVVIQSGHVLLVKRKFEPGKGLLALPGGFIRGSESIENAAVRELKEETGIRLHVEKLKDAIENNHVFDHPSRSLRGRTITHAYHLILQGRELIEVKGNDDAEQAFWMPLMDLGRREAEFYEDHAHIISYFVNVVKG